MSPEQSRGQAVDKRTDIWAFGCVLYEMLTGRPSFAGETISDTLAAVLKQEPDWQALPADTPPPAIRSLLRRCLRRSGRSIARHRRRANRDSGGHRRACGDDTNRPATTCAARWTRMIPWVVAAGAVAMALLVVQQGSRRTGSPAGSVTRLDLDLPAGVELVTVYPTGDGALAGWNTRGLCRCVSRLAPAIHASARSVRDRPDPRDGERQRGLHVAGWSCAGAHHGGSRAEKGVVGGRSRHHGRA